jgi:hypothetical protein
MPENTHSLLAELVAKVRCLNGSSGFEMKKGLSGSS